MTDPYMDTTITLNVTTTSNQEARLMLHEQVASGDYSGHDFTAIRDLTGLHWQVKIGDVTATFSLSDAIKEIVITTVDKLEAA